MDHYHSHGDPYYGVLELCLNDILSYIKPSESDRLKRLNTINELTTIVRSMESLKDVGVRPFGSFISNMYTKWGDLDTFIELSHVSPSCTGKRQKQKVLWDIMRVLRRNGVARNFTSVARARVPLLIFESNRHNVSCDLSVDNHVGWMKSRILLRISEIDERLRDMVLLTKVWAKSHHINDPKSGTLNSHSLCLLVIFHFQTCKPPILPPLKDIYEGNFFDIAGPWSSLERQIEDGCAANIEKFKSFRQRNQSTLCQLLISFFDKFSRIESLSSDYAICTYTGQWEMMSSNPRWTEKPHDLLIEDPFERPDNAARAVGLRTLCVISEAFMTAYQKLSSYSVLSDRNALLDCLVRPDMRAQIHYGTRENQKEPQPAYSGYATFHEFSEVSSQHKIGTQNRYNGRENPEEPQLAYSGYATAHEFSEVSSECKVGTQSRSTAKQNRKGDTPQVAFSGYAVRAPDHEKIQEAVGNHNSQSSPSVITRQREDSDHEKIQEAVGNHNSQSSPSVITRQREDSDHEKIQEAVGNHKSQSSPSVITRQRQEYTTNWELGTPQVAFSGYAVCAPDHEKIQAAVNKHNGQALPSVITGQRQGNINHHDKIQAAVNKHNGQASPSVISGPRQGYINEKIQAAVNKHNGQSSPPVIGGQRQGYINEKIQAAVNKQNGQASPSVITGQRQGNINHHEKIQAAVNKHNGQASPSVISGQRQGHINEKIQAAVNKHNDQALPSVITGQRRGYINHHEKIQAAVNKHNGQASPSVITGQRQGHRHEQQIWRPKNQSR